MIAYTLIALLCLTCHSQSSRAKHNRHNVNVKKSFLSDAMNEMEYGSGHKPQRHNKSAIKDGIVSITRIYPSHLVQTVKVHENEDEKGKNKNGDTTSLEQNTKSNDGVQNEGEDKKEENKNTQDSLNPEVSSASDTSDITEVVTNDSESSHSKEDVTTAISLLRSFVKKLLKQNNTEQASSSTNKTAKHGNELKSDAEAHSKAAPRGNPVNPSTIVSGVKYNLAPVYKFKAKEEKQERLKHLMEEEETLRQTLQAKEHEIKKLQQEQDINNNHLNKNNKTTDQEKHKNNTSRNDATTKSLSKDDTAGLQAAKNETNEAQFKFSTLKGIPPELLVKLKSILDARKKKKENVSTQQTSSRKAFETAKKLVKAAFAREQLYKAEEDFYGKVKEMMNKTSDTSAKENANSSEVIEQGSADGDFAHVNEYIKTLEAEQKNLDPVERRTQAANTSSSSTAQDSTAKSPLNTSPHTNAAAGLPLNTASSQNILNQLNHTKGADEKSVEAAAHLEEKVAEQQDEMYEDLIRHTLNKGRGYEDDDDDDDDEEAEARDAYNRPAEDGPRLSQENYGDFQDSDERTHLRSEVINSSPRKSNNLHYIDENAIYSLKKDK